MTTYRSDADVWNVLGDRTRRTILECLVEQPLAVVEIADPGQGMSPEEISAVYARAARGGGRDGGGIGLDLITRLCAHLGWGLAIDSRPGEGTTARLDLGASRVQSGAV